MMKKVFNRPFVSVLSTFVQTQYNTSLMQQIPVKEINHEK